MVHFTSSRHDERDSPILDPSASSVTGVSDIDDSVNGSEKHVRDESRADSRSSRKKKRRRAKDGGISEINGHSSSSKRRHSISKAARDPRDEPSKRKRKREAKVSGVDTRSPSPVIDFDGLSRPSTLNCWLD